MKELFPGIPAGIGKKAIFLDFDGVLNVDPPPEGKSYRSHSHPLFNPLTHLDREFVERVYKLTVEFDCEVVLSTSWVDNDAYSVSACRAFLQAKGFEDTDRIVGKTPRNASYKKAARWEQIQGWIVDKGINRPSNFVIIDDNPMASNEDLQKYFVRTYEWKGFDLECYERAREILSGCSF